MRCTLGLNENWELVVGYAARTLDPRTRASFEKHLKSCEACSETVAVQQAVWDALDEQAAVAVSSDFDQRLQARIAHQEQAWWERKFWDQGGLRSWQAAMPVAAACLVFGVAFWFYRPQHVELVTQGSPASTAQTVLRQTAPQPDPQLDKLEHALDDMDMLGKLSSATVPEKAGAQKRI
jgi:hypothetical protein